MEVPVLTQSALDDFKFELQNVVANLADHVNESLSLAHGINLIKTPYLDNHGNQISAWMARWSVNGVLYYSPAASTALPGNPTTTGLVDFSGTPTTPLEDTAWVTSTDEVTTEPNDVNKLITDHALLGHWEVHGGVVAVTKDSFDTFGNKIGRNVLQLAISGQTYEIPCDTRFGGPV